MTTEVYDTYHVGASHIADTMPSGLTLYTEPIVNAEMAYTLTLADGQGLTWTRDTDHDRTWTDRIIDNAVRNETDLNRLARLLNMYGIESHWCNHVEMEESIKETTITAYIPEPEDDNIPTTPHRIYTIKTSDTGMTWVHIYKWADMRAACDPTDAMNVIRNNERLEQA